MNTRERFLATMTFQEPDRVPLWEAGYWSDTLRRWYQERLPKREGIHDDATGGVPSLPSPSVPCQGVISTATLMIISRWTHRYGA